MSLLRYGLCRASIALLLDSDHYTATSFAAELSCVNKQHTPLQTVVSRKFLRAAVFYAACWLTSLLGLRIAGTEQFCGVRHTTVQDLSNPSHTGPKRASGCDVQSG